MNIIMFLSIITQVLYKFQVYNNISNKNITLSFADNVKLIILEV